MTLIELYSLFAVEKRGAPVGWGWRLLEKIGDVMERDPKKSYNRMTGYVHNGARFKKGKNKGQLKPKSPVEGTEREIIFTSAEFNDFLEECKTKGIEVNK